MKLNVITRCTRVENLKAIHESFQGNELTWHVVFDTSVIKELEADLLGWLYTVAKVYFKKGEPGTYMYPLMNDLIKENTEYDELITFIDDDNIMHPDYYDEIEKSVKDIPTPDAICYHQFVDLKANSARFCSPENTVVGGIDLAQYTFKSDIIHYDVVLFKGGYCGDGEFIQELHNKKLSTFVFLDKILSYYNYLQQVTPKKTSAPSILYVGEGKPVLESHKHLGYEDTSLNVNYVKNDELTEFDFSKYDAIITTEDNWENVNELPQKSSTIRERWINVKEEEVNGELAYNVAMNSILSSKKPKVSFFTPVYKTPLDRLIRLYNSIISQTMQDWEWVIVNDSPKHKELCEFLDYITKIEARIKVHTFEKASGGCIGEAKFKAASLCVGDLLAEVDHDDELMPNCAKYLVDAAKKNKRCGFFYTDCVELDENGNSMTYPAGFAFGYGSYRKEGDWDVSVCVGVNPKTIRHIVGVPNHIRAWRRKVYHAVGGHNQRLTIADDYELIVRTFLHTKFCHIQALGYIQYIYNNHTGQNTHDATRGDIQRRVRTIAQHYNHDIAMRFFYLGATDWAYEHNPLNPLLAESRFGEKENAVDVKYNPNR